MTIADLRKKYTKGELTSTSGDLEFRYLALSPLFAGLFENKVVYHERVTSIIKLEEIVITPQEFSATAVRLMLIDNGRPIYKRKPPEKWTISANWAYMRLVGNGLSMYSGWIIWTEPDLVKKVEQLVLAEKFRDALDLTVYCDDK